MTQLAAPLQPVVRQLDWTIERYHHAIEMGVLTEDDRIELLNGILVKKMSIGEQHAACVSDLIEYFMDRFGKEYKFRSKNPITLPNDSEPEPDFIVANRIEDNYRTGHPTPKDIHLVIEVSENTLDQDRKWKSRIYAAASLPEYWIINLKNRQLELHLQPAEDGTYGTVQHFKEDSSFTSPFVGEVAVADLLP
ncbi:MAG: Uma2 family endonuclease [Bacteroidota bacterium]